MVHFFVCKKRRTRRTLGYIRNRKTEEKIVQNRKTAKKFGQKTCNTQVSGQQVYMLQTNVEQISELKSKRGSNKWEENNK